MILYIKRLLTWIISDLVSTYNMQRTAQLGGKGTPRRKIVKKPTAPTTSGDDKKLMSALGKMNVQQIQAIDQVSSSRLFKNY